MVAMNVLAVIGLILAVVALGLGVLNLCYAYRIDKRKPDRQYPL